MKQLKGRENQVLLVQLPLKSRQMHALEEICWSLRNRLDMGVGGLLWMYISDNSGYLNCEYNIMNTFQNHVPRINFTKL